MISLGMKRWWYYRPFQYNSWGISHGSDEYNRCTCVIGTPITGHIIWARDNRACLRVDKDAGMAYVSVAGATGVINTKELGDGITIDVHAETGALVGVEITLNNDPIQS